ncbi:MAG: DUF342 domain-containing protein [Desulfobacteraceae bacterium]|nr:DUF342 domain-containing protein [Desulfobacteraceae bacterium]
MATQNDGKPKIPLIGALAVKNLLITKEELQKGLLQCSDSKNLNVALKEYFLANELISSKNMERLIRAAKALEMRQKEYKFGAIAIRKGFINQSVLKLALEEQQDLMKTSKKFRLVGDLLVEAGMLTEKQRDYILKLQKRVRQEVKKGSEEKVKKDTGKEDIKQDTVKEDEKPVAQSDQKQSADTLEEVVPEEKIEEAGLLEPEIIAGGIKLEIANDFMAAFLSKTEYFDKKITLTEIKGDLIDKGIVLGITEDKMIEGFVNSSGFKTKSFRVAKGVTPIQGKDAKLEFFFNTDYLKAGDLTNDGTIDFKDRGEIPHVEEGTVLAEKVPMVEARRGHTIFGDEIETIPGNDIAIKLGKGAKLSEDGLKVIADVSGFPKYTLSGQVYVLQEYVTEGDVDYETGHINYNGNINVKGRIKSGFKVEGNDVSAIELDGGIITAEGNVRIAGGINEGKIYSRGNVYAKFIHKSEVICMGDVIVEKEIVDADVECSGTCVAENGKLMSSRITAKMGVKAKNIGTEMGGPSVVKVGHDAFTEKEIEKNKEQVDRLKEQIKHHLEKKGNFEEDNLALQKQITELAHVQDRSQLEEKDCNSKISSMEKDGANLSSVNELKQKIESLKKNAKQAEENLDKCFDESEKIEELMEKQDKEIDDLKIRRDEFLEERTNLMAWAKDNPGKSVVIVTGAIMPGTAILGVHCEKRFDEVTQHSRIMEVLSTSTDGRSLNIYEMQVGNI